MVLKTKVNLLVAVSILLAMSGFCNAQEKKTKVEPTTEVVEEVEIVEVDAEQEPEFIPFNAVNEVPYSEECENYKTNEERKKCFVEFIRNHTIRKFNTDLPRELGLSAGKKRIFVGFKIDVTGNVVDVKSRAEHEDLEKEIERVINLLPKFIPGKHKGKVVTVAYSLPVIFTIEEYEVKGDKQKN